MIVVIADDLSGAAELAGVAQARGLTAEVQTVFDSATSAQVIAVDADTRSGSAEAAKRRMAEIARRITGADPAWIYKKTDSVLRGHVRVELTALLAETGRPRVLFIPANPSRGRVIQGGRYFVNGDALDQTVFNADPEYPATSSKVYDLLCREPGAEVRILLRTDALPAEGIVVPEITGGAELTGWAAAADDVILCAGASEFFGALLAARCPEARGSHSFHPSPADSAVSLFVCGSAAAWPQRQRECQERLIPIFAWPNEPFAPRPNGDKPRLDRWCSAVCRGLGDAGSALVAIGDAPGLNIFSPAELVRSLAATVPHILKTVSVHRLFLEGGATAAAVLREMGWVRLTAREPFATGVAAFQPDGVTHPLLAIKPGSYDWPEQVWPARSRISAGRS